MSKLLFVLFVFTILYKLIAGNNIRSFCREDILRQHHNRTKVEKRILFVVTCSTKPDQYYNDSIYYKTLEPLMQQGLFLTNPCQGQSWGGYMTKPRAYTNYVNFLTTIHNHKKIHVLLTDRDVYWGTNSLQELWLAYDCAREGKDLLLSVESTCWVGRPCNEADMSRLYPNLTFPSIMPFINSGVIIGKLANIAELLQHFMNHMNIYKIDNVFHDQTALNYYAIEKIPGQYALDYHHLFSTTCLLFESKSYIHRDGQLSAPCLDYSGEPMMNYYCDYVFANLTLTEDCLLQRRPEDNPNLTLDLSSVANRAMLWHFNGPEKNFCINQVLKAHECLQQKTQVVGV